MGQTPPIKLLLMHDFLKQGKSKNMHDMKQVIDLYCARLSAKLSIHKPTWFLDLCKMQVYNPYNKLHWKASTMTQHAKSTSVHLEIPSSISQASWRKTNPKSPFVPHLDTLIFILICSQERTFNRNERAFFLHARGTRIDTQHMMIVSNYYILVNLKQKLSPYFSVSGPTRERSTITTNLSLFICWIIQTKQNLILFVLGYIKQRMMLRSPSTLSLKTV